MCVYIAIYSEYVAARQEYFVTVGSSRRHFQSGARETSPTRRNRRQLRAEGRGSAAPSKRVLVRARPTRLRVRADRGAHSALLSTYLLIVLGQLGVAAKATASSCFAPSYLVRLPALDKYAYAYAYAYA